MATVGGSVAHCQASTILCRAHFQLVISLTNVSSAFWSKCNDCGCVVNCGGTMAAIGVLLLPLPNVSTTCGRFSSRDMEVSSSSFEGAYLWSVFCCYET